MTSIYQSIGEKMAKNEKWEYFNTSFRVAIARDEKEGYLGSVWFTDKEYRAKSNDMFTLWGNMKDFIAAKRQELLFACNSSSEFCKIEQVQREDLQPRPHQKYVDKALELMK